MSLDRGEIDVLWTHEFHLFLKIVSRAKSPSSQRGVEYKVFFLSSERPPYAIPN